SSSPMMRGWPNAASSASRWREDVSVSAERASPLAALRLGARALRRDLRNPHLLVVALALVIATAGMTAVGTFTDRVQRGLSAQAGQLLAADLALVSSRELPTGLARAAARAKLEISHQTSLRSMIKHADGLQMVELKAVDDAYPLRGTLQMASTAAGVPRTTDRDKTEPTAADEALRQRAEKLLADAWGNLSLQSSTSGVLEGTNDLVGLYLQGGRLDEALKVLNEPTKGSIAILKAIPDSPLPAQLDAYRLNLQAMVQSAGQGRADLSAEQIDQAITTMKGLCDKAGDTTMLPKALQNLAAELQGQLEANKNAEQQAKLASCFKILIEQLTGVSGDPAVIESAGAAMIVLATNMEKVPALAAKAPEMMATAEKAFTKLSSLSPAELERIKRKPEEIMLKLALTKRGAKKYEEANKLFIEALQKNQNNITVQMEAARNLQQWSGNKDIEKLKAAMLGAEPLPNKKKLIWGWGQIAQVTARYPNFQKEFFEARLNIARCRGLIGDASSGADKQKLYEAGITDISQTYSRFQELGGPESRNEFDRLLRELQQKANKPTTGLAGLPKIEGEAPSDK
ncbi:MAG: hypothetical protein ACKOAU_20965, partial [Pirellula sp.]